VNISEYFISCSVLTKMLVQAVEMVGSRLDTTFHDASDGFQLPQRVGTGFGISPPRDCIGRMRYAATHLIGCSTRQVFNLPHMLGEQTKPLDNAGYRMIGLSFRGRLAD
jgi:hypothetical protein